MQQQQKAQKIGNQNKVEIVIQKNKNMVEIILKGLINMQ